jgi:hypothetical protein
LRGEEIKPEGDSIPSGRLAPWLPMFLVIGGFSLSWLPSHSAALNALLVGMYLTYTAAVTELHILPWLSNKLNR